MMLTPYQKARGAKLRAMHWGWKTISDHLGVGIHTLRGDLQDGYREYRRLQAKRARQGFEPSFHRKRKISHMAPKTQEIPISVLDERDERMARDYSPICALLGDPRPGQSALDKKVQHAG